MGWKVEKLILKITFPSLLWLNFLLNILESRLKTCVSNIDMHALRRNCLRGRIMIDYIGMRRLLQRCTDDRQIYFVRFFKVQSNRLCATSHTVQVFEQKKCYCILFIIVLILNVWIRFLGKYVRTTMTWKLVSYRFRLLNRYEPNINCTAVNVRMCRFFTASGLKAYINKLKSST